MCTFDSSCSIFRFYVLSTRRPPISTLTYTLFPYPTLFRSRASSMVRTAFVPSANCDAGVMINGPISCVGCRPVAPSIPVAELAADGTVREISGVDVDVEARGVRLNLVGDSLGRLRAALDRKSTRLTSRH